MYCARCGIKLAQSERACPLCHLVAFHPDLLAQTADRPYPDTVRQRPRVARTAGAVLLTAIVFVVLIFTLVCNLKLTGNVSWWKYVSVSMGLMYFIWILPMWFAPIPKEILTFFDFIAVGGFLSLVNLFAKTDWFLSFAFPTLGFLALLVFAVWMLIKYIPKCLFFTIGGAFVGLGAFMLLLEFLMDYTFRLPYGFQWSLYVLTAMCLFGGVFLLIGFCRPLRQALSKKLFF